MLAQPDHRDNFTVLSLPVKKLARLAANKFKRFAKRDVIFAFCFYIYHPAPPRLDLQLLLQRPKTAKGKVRLT